MVENGMEKTQLADVDATQMVQPADRTQMAVTVTCPVCGVANQAGEEYCVDCGFLLSSTPVDVAEEAAPEALPKLVDIATGREFLLKPGENIVGRQDADVLLPHPTVSRKHAKLTVADGHYVLEDLESANGTFVTGAKIEPGQQVHVQSGTEISFGSAVLRFEAPAPDVAIAAAEAVREVEEAEEREEEAEESVAVEQAAEEPTPPPVESEKAQEEAADESEAAEIPVGDGIESEFKATPEQALEEPVQPVEIHEEAPTLARLVPQAGGDELVVRKGDNSVGRRPANDIVIPDPFVSGSHAVIAASDGDFTITDLGSTNGTTVNGEKLAPNAPRELSDGDEISFGESMYRFTTGASDE